MACNVLDALYTLLYSVLFEIVVIILTLLTDIKMRSEMIHELKSLMYDRSKNQIHFCLTPKAMLFFHFIFSHFAVSGKKIPSYQAI